jgi:two-component system, OmpR family, phosphate regulon response regulator PhoB
MAEILILDDCGDILQLLRSIFEVKGYEARTCLTTGEFFNQLQKKLPDLVLIDVKLSDGDGRDVCIQIKETIATRHIPVLLISANPDKLRESKTPADDILDKPFDLKELHQKVSNLLSTKDQQPYAGTLKPARGYWWENETYY